MDSCSRISLYQRTPRTLSWGAFVAVSALSLSVLQAKADPLAHVSNASQAIAEQQRPQHGFLIRLRTVKGERPTVARAGISVDPARVNIDERIADLRDKLLRYQYRDYRLVSSEERLVEDNTVEQISMSDGHSVTVRPVSLSKDRVGLWLRWKDPQGMEVLNTKMKFDSHDNMLAGVEGSNNIGTILAVGVEPMGKSTPQ